MRFAIKSSNNNSIGSLLNRKADLIKNIFILLLVQIIITGLVAHFTISKKKPAVSSSSPRPSNAKIALAVLIFIAIIAILWIMIGIIMDPSRNPILRISLFTIISVFMGMGLSYVKTLPARVVAMATIGTITAFFVMAGIGYYAASKGIDLSPMGIWLFGALIIMMVVSLVLYIAYPKDPLVRRIITTIFVVIFSLYIMYETNEILRGQMDYIEGSFSYYIDIINIFKDLLYLFSDDN